MSGSSTSITRDSVLEITESEWIAHAEARLTVYHVYNADEVFFCGTGGGIFVVSTVDDRRIGDGKMGPITSRTRDVLPALPGRLAWHADR